MNNTSKYSLMSDADRKMFRGYYTGGIPIDKIAWFFKMSTSTVYKTARTLGLKRISNKEIEESLKNGRITFTFSDSADRSHDSCIRPSDIIEGDKEIKMNDHTEKPAPFCGDEELKENLLHSAEKQFILGRSQEVIQSFREAAKSYRVSATTFAALIDYYQDQRDQTDILQLYRNWGNAYAGKIDPVWEGNGPIPGEFIGEIVDKLLDYSTFSVIFLHLEYQLEIRGIEIFSPGGSIQRRVAGMLYVGFNKNELDTEHEILCRKLNIPVESLPKKDAEYETLIRKFDIRVALEPIAQIVFDSWRGNGRETFQMRKMVKGCLNKKVSIERRSADGYFIDEQTGEPSRYSIDDEPIRQLKRKMKEGDEIWEFRSPPESWKLMIGRAGLCVVRDGDVVDYIITTMN